jgi:hypothetical protein
MFSDPLFFVESAAATAGATGAGTATAASFAHRIFRGNGKTGTVSGVKKIHLNGTTGCQQSLLHQKLNTIFFKRLVIVFWLIQSQSQ